MAWLFPVLVYLSLPPPLGFFPVFLSSSLCVSLPFPLSCFCPLLLECGGGLFSSATVIDHSRLPWAPEE